MHACSVAHAVEFVVNFRRVAPSKHPKQEEKDERESVYEEGTVTRDSVHSTAASCGMGRGGGGIEWCE